MFDDGSAGSSPGLHAYSGLHAYCGEEIERLEKLGQPNCRRTFGEDRSGRRTYDFNELGYRGGLDLEAPQRVFVFGESHAFGYFVELEESWPSRFLELWTRYHGLDLDDVGLVNFADPGSSNAAIARQVVTQCSAVRPDLVLVHFADVRRSEVVLDERPHRVGPWLLEESAARSAEAAPGKLPVTLRELIERGKSFFRYAFGQERAWLSDDVDATCLLHNLRDMLLVQSFCRAEEIPLIATCESIERLHKPAVRRHPVLGPLVDCLDTDSLCDFHIWSVEGDQSEEPGHAGPARHARFARCVFDYFYHRDPGS